MSGKFNIIRGKDGNLRWANGSPTIGKLQQPPSIPEVKQNTSVYSPEKWRVKFLLRNFIAIFFDINPGEIYDKLIQFRIGSIFICAINMAEYLAMEKERGIMKISMRFGANDKDVVDLYLDTEKYQDTNFAVPEMQYFYPEDITVSKETFIRDIATQIKLN